jgi:tetratricopeptide (TPR) repeat protein
MRPRPRARASLLVAALAATLVPACGGTGQPEPAATPNAQFPDPTEGKRPQAAHLKNEVPADQLDAVVRDLLQGLGYMERYEYGKATAVFRDAHDRAPGWIPGSINLAIALLNDTGTQAETAKKSGGGAGGAGGNFDEALALLEGVIARDPNSLHAHFCRGLILEFLGQGKAAEAHREFQFVTERDPADGHAWLKLGSTLTSPDDPGQPAGPAQAERLVEIYSKALECNPYLVPALYKLQQAYSWARRRDKQTELLARWRQFNPKENPAGPGEIGGSAYGETGKYAQVINPFAVARVEAEPVPPPRFDPPAAVQVTLGEGERWVKAEDFQGPLAPLGRARARFGATVVSFDADGDGRTDLFLAAAVKGPKGVRDALLRNKPDGAFEDVSKAWGLPDDRPSLGAAAADFDADRRVDLFLTGLDGNRLLRNDGGKGFVDVTEKAGVKDTNALAVTARWLDLDQDGDLDLYVVNYTERSRAADAFGDNDSALPPVRNAAYRNDGKPARISGPPENNWAPIAVAPPDLPAKEGLSLALNPWPNADALSGPPGHYTAVAALDLDDDRDIDLVLGGNSPLFLAVLNDRLGAFHTQEIKDVYPSEPVSGLLVADFDKDGRADLLAVSASSRASAWRNTVNVGEVPRKVSFAPGAVDAKGWRAAVAADLDLDTWPDAVGLPSKTDTPVVDWARNEGQRLATRPLPVGPGEGDVPGLSGFVLADVAGDALPDLVTTADGAPPRVARNLGNGLHWIALDLGGRWKTSFDHMRTNPHGLGTRITLEGQGLLVSYDHTTPNAGLGQSVAPAVLGLGKSPSIELLRLRWPDGTMQCELNQKADTKLALAEYNRKTGSCPVLFTWNGERFVCLGDFLGGGGLGYLVAPGVYGQPDRDESVTIAPDQLKSVGGVFRLSVTEPMDEVAYLDRLRLVVVDRPPGVSCTANERFAPEGPRPTGEVVAWTERVEPVRASDQTGRDVTKTLRAWDRDTVDGFRRLDGWVGYAEEHGIVLDFGDRLSRFGRDDRLVLCLAGWVEYPYSQTNYAAATAGVALKPPAVERQNADGSWTVIEPNAGYPAGMPRMTTLDLTGKLTGPRCALRLRTNMECYWDQAFVARRDAKAEASLRQTTLGVARAVLGHRGYTREVSPDGKPPLLYDYDYVDPSPLALMAGKLTRHGDVAPLLRNDDDRLCLVGPGDEVRLEFDGRDLPALPAGWTRSYVFKAEGYCKDADPFTAGSDRVEPLPWKAMPPFPFPPGVERPADDAYRAYLREYQTRPAGGRD